MILPALLVVCLFSLADSRSNSYTGEQVLKCPLPESTAVQRLWDVLDVWGVNPDGTIDVRVKNPQEKQFLESVLDNCKTVIDDVEQEVQKWEAQRASASKADWFGDYHNYTDLDQWYTDLAASNPDLLTYTPLNTTYEGNTIKVLKISANPNARQAVYMQALIHAREWISGATANYIVNQLVTDYRAGSPDVVNLLNLVNIHLVPILNIDGYRYTWYDTKGGQGDRLWRKNRSQYVGSVCFGTDVNRNYNDHWGQGGSSTMPCSDTYMGPSVQSERETQTTQNYFASIAPVVFGLDWHSYSQLVLRPYGWTSADSPDEPVLSQQGAAYAANVQAAFGRVYTSQKSIQLYVTTGTASDWFYGTGTNNNLGRRAAGYTVELRPVNNVPGFELPPAEIIPTGIENYRALIPMLTYFATNPLNA